jgi:hypothetical protein
MNEQEAETQLKPLKRKMRTYEMGERQVYKNLEFLKKEKFKDYDEADKHWKLNMDRVMELTIGIQKDLEELKEDTDFMDPSFYNMWNRLSRRPKVNK